MTINAIILVMLDLAIGILCILIVLLSVAFATLAERKVMGSMQRRLGPNKVGIYGLLQPLADGGKLLLKETVIPAHANIGLFLLAPIITLAFSLIGWMVIPFNHTTVIFDTPLGILFVLAISSLGIYGVIFSGWAANSKYAFLGSLRSTAQMISYEVVLGLIILTVIFCLGDSFSLSQIITSQQAVWYIIPLAPLGILFFISALAETNRPPFDLPEAESEVVAGYFTEHSGMPFAYFFLGEYSSILLISRLTVILFLGGCLAPFGGTIIPAGGLSFILGCKVAFIFFAFIWVRATFPRWKYTQLIVICWTSLLPLTLGFVTIVPSLILTLS
uniref:NADH-ubiquinone oxidoreductase chain 1 n=1 Tax=Blastocladiella sp. TaxID=2169676 RepID=A0A890JI94_9FUNG|nr:NADH dehydrogenase subunit 1 [Blastocladiella sp.]